MHDANHTDFAALLRALDGPAKVAPLVTALGFRALPGVRRLRAAGMDAMVVGERAGARVLLLEFGEGVEAPRIGVVARAIRDRDLATHHLFLATDAGWSRVFVACIGLEGELRHARIEPDAVTAADAETLAEMVSPREEPGLAVALRHARALDRGRVTDRFFEDFRALRARVAAAWEGIPEHSKASRDELALLLLCRLMFLYFLQRAGRLGGDRAFLPRRLNEHRDAGRRGFYRVVLRPLFFGALNRRPENRSARARALGPLPYLNGGLFERVAAERRHPRLNLPDDATAAIFDDLLERYRFAPRESGEDRMEAVSAVAVDPEMLGRVFERLMEPDRRGRTGTFYTPAPLVDAVVGESLTALLAGRLGIAAGEAASIVGGVPPGDAALHARIRKTASGLRVLDPACGSGAFLLGALSRLTRLAAEDGEDPAEVRRRIVATGLHGVDLQGDAALLCSLRLWLALALGAPDPVPPLPNLDRRIRQGDALLGRCRRWPPATWMPSRHNAPPSTGDWPPRNTRWPAAGWPPRRRSWPGPMRSCAAGSRPGICGATRLPRRPARGRRSPRYGARAVNSPRCDGGSCGTANCPSSASVSTSAKPPPAGSTWCFPIRPGFVPMPGPSRCAVWRGIVSRSAATPAGPPAASWRAHRPPRVRRSICPSSSSNVRSTCWPPAAPSGPWSPPRPSDRCTAAVPALSCCGRRGSMPSTTMDSTSAPSSAPIPSPRPSSRRGWPVPRLEVRESA